ncbi:S9 family peptidase [Humisphaera borealis]|uniref:S9 family peptidase n=1 Tax=Humisphaera borealis TaxID=2807512 RepID=A0A7M2WXW7_9BACT|nr:S9 family peptidase [Humisphaera borealis]QOV90325.1 S9 family peptidase [Humisphaera borealis]
MKSRLLLSACAIAAAALSGAAAETPSTQPVLTPASNLVVDGIPPIPQAIADEVNRYTEFRSAGLASWHPVKRQMLIRTRFADTVQIHEVTQPLGMRKQVTFFPDSVSDAYYPPMPAGGDANWFILAKDIGGSEFDQLFKYDLTSGDVTLLTDGKSRNSGPRFSKDGKKFVYTSTRRNRKDPDFYVASSDAPGDAKMVYQADAPGWFPAAWSPDGSLLLTGKFSSANESSLWIVNPATGEKTRLSPETEKPTRYSGGYFSADGKGVYLTTDAGSEFERLAYIDIATKEIAYLAPDAKWDVEDFTVSDDGKLLAYTTNEDGSAVLHLLDTATRKELPLPKLPPGQISTLSFHANSQDLGIVLNSAKAPSDVYSVDVKSGVLTRWTQSETAGLNTDNFPDPSLVRWKSFDGLQISGFLYKPDAAKFPGKRPVIINIHGGPESQFRPGFMGSYNYYFTKLGCAAIFPNVRGSSGYGKTFLTLDNAEKREDSVKDIGALLDWIKTQPDLDPDRVMVVGGSYGGYMTLAVSVHYADRIRCAIDVVGISNFVSFLERTEPYRQDLRRVEYGDERNPAMRKVLEQISPLNNVAKIRKPLMVVHGANDPRVPLFEAEQIVKAMKEKQTPVWMLVAKDEGHGFAKKSNFQFQFYATVAFVRKFLL